MSNKYLFKLTGIIKMYDSENCRLTIFYNLKIYHILYTSDILYYYKSLQFHYLCYFYKCIYIEAEII